MRTAVIVGGAVALAVGGYLVLGSSSAKADEPLETKGTRSGIFHDGCEVFRLEDAEAFKSWAMGKKLFFVPWAAKLEEVKENPEDLLLAVFGELFPDCDWPPSDSARFNGMSWESVIDKVKSELADFSLAGEDSSSGSEDAARLFSTIFLSVWRPLPRPEEMDSVDMGTSATRALVTLEDFAGLDLGSILDPKDGIQSPPRVLVVGHDDRWIGWPATLTQLEAVAQNFPDLDVVYFSFTDTRRLFGMPTAGETVAYYASSVDPYGVPLAQGLTSGNLASPSLSPSRVGSLLDHALSGEPLPSGGSVEYLALRDGMWSILVLPEGAAWRWYVWSGIRTGIDSALFSGMFLNKSGALRSAKQAAAMAASEE